MSRRGGAVAASRVRGGPNNATGIALWSSYAAFVGNQPTNNTWLGMTDARIAEWRNQRACVRLVETGIECEKIRGGTPAPGRYNDDGSLVTGTQTVLAAWSQQALETNWDGGTKTWPQRISQLGFKQSLMGMYSYVFNTSHIAFETHWHNDTAWGATTVAGALTPGVGSFLEDFTRYCKAGTLRGFGGVAFDFEQETDAVSHPYAGMPGGQTELQTRNYVILRARQMALIVATYMSYEGGPPEMGAYKTPHHGSDKELIFYKTQAGGVSEDIFKFATHDSFLAGLATEPGIGAVRFIEEDFYRLDVSHFLGDSSANDSHRTRIDNAFLLDFGRRRARVSQMLAFASALTDAERLAAMRKVKNHAFIWPGDTTDGGPHTPANFALLLAGASRWSMDGLIFQYQRGTDDAFNEVPPAHNIDQFEASYAALASERIDDAPTVTITSPTSPHSSAGANVTLLISVSFSVAAALDRIEVNNQTTGITYFCPFQWIHNDPANWNPLDSQKRPNRTILSLVPFHCEAGTIAPNTVTPGVVIPRAVGENIITARAWSTHQVVGSASIISTRTS